MQIMRTQKEFEKKSFEIKSLGEYLDFILKTMCYF